jgi:hypothetical protein
MTAAAAATPASYSSGYAAAQGHMLGVDGKPARGSSGRHTSGATGMQISPHDQAEFVQDFFLLIQCEGCLNAYVLYANESLASARGERG